MKTLGISLGAWSLLATAAFASPPGPASTGPSAAAAASTPVAASASTPIAGTALRAAVREALIAARKQPQPDTAAVRKLTKLYRTLELDTSLAQNQREALRLAVRARLKAWAVRLEHTAAQLPAAQQPNAAAVPPQVLAQQAPQGAGQPPATTQPPADHSRELLEVIQDTIAPDTWDVRGGPGVIRFWPPGSALIVRQTGDVHEQLGRLLGDLRQ
jgi:hypothetical protein